MLRLVSSLALCLLLAGCGPAVGQQLPTIGQIMLAPLSFVRDTGNFVLTTGGRAVNSVPGTVNSLSNAAVTGVRVVPDTVNLATNAAVNTVSGVPNAFRTVGNAATAPIRGLGLPLPLQRQSGAPRPAAPIFAAPVSGVANFGGEVVNAGTTGLVTVANDGVNVVTGIPNAAIGLGGTAFRTGEAVVGGGARVAFAIGDSAIRTGMNALNGGARFVLTSANTGAQLATDTMRRLF